jgi:hypothetical protein
MNPSRQGSRPGRGSRLSLEALEGRQLLSAGMGSTFAIMPGIVEKAGETSSIEFRLDPAHFKAGRGGRILLGFDVAADPSTKIKPVIAGVREASGGRPLSLQHSFYTPEVVRAQSLNNPTSSAVTAMVRLPRPGQPPSAYVLQVRGNYETSGKYLVGFYLPGDANGDGMVDSSDLKLIRAKLGATPSSSNYSFDADVNRDGKISRIDLSKASQNLGVKTTISPIIDVNLDPATDGPMRTRMTNFRTVRFTGTATPNATVTFTEVRQNSPGATTTVDATGHYSILVPLGDGSNTFKVTTSDGFGQSISGTIAPVTYTPTPPVVVNTPQEAAAVAARSGGSTTTNPPPNS